MSERIVIELSKLKELCPSCAEKVEKTLTKGTKITKVSVSKADYAWLNLAKDGRPPKEWWDRCIASVGQKEGVDDPEALCGWIYTNKVEEDSESDMLDEESIATSEEAYKKEECVKADFTKLKEKIEKVMAWRKEGKMLTKAEQEFANSVVDEMIGYKVLNKVGVQIISRDRVTFIKQQQAIGSDRVGIVDQDSTSYPQPKDGKFPRKTGDKVDVAKVSKPSGEKPKEMPTSSADSGNKPKNTPDIANIKLAPPENQKEGEVSSKADVATTAKDSTGQPDPKVPSEAIGHNPNEPMPKKMAEDLVNNAKWGVKIGAYTNVKEGIERQLSRKAYAEFTDTPEKLKTVSSYLAGLVKETEPEKVA